MPSPVPERPGVLIRDPYRYTEAMVIVPPLLAQCLSFFDGEQTDLDLLAHLVRLTGQLVPAELVERMADTLGRQGFLHTTEFEALKESKRRAFREAPVREPVHAGPAYPNEDAGLRQRLDEYSRDGHEPASPASPAANLIGVAAPHVSPEGGWRSYAAAYRRLGPEQAEKTFILLGTSHYGAPEKFGLTRKPFVTPLGTLEPDLELINGLAERGGDAVLVEDYCHSIEHSIEFQCIFLQHRLGNGVKIAPVLCGPLVESLLTGKPPESNDSLRRFFEVLGEWGEQHRGRVFWVLGIDLAHIGRRYGDPFQARAEDGRLSAVHRADQERLEKVCAGDSEGFFELVKPNQDELRWCGYSPVYTFLRAVPEARGHLLRYEQWNIDEMSVVSFAAIEFGS